AVGSGGRTGQVALEVNASDGPPQPDTRVEGIIRPLLSLHGRRRQPRRQRIAGRILPIPEAKSPQAGMRKGTTRSIAPDGPWSLTQNLSPTRSGQSTSFQVTAPRCASDAWSGECPAGCAPARPGHQPAPRDAGLGSESGRTPGPGPGLGVG